MDMLDILWKEYNKKVQLLKVSLVSHSFLTNQKSQVAQIRNNTKDSITLAMDTTEDASKNLQETIQGQFGHKVTTMLEKQKNTLNDLK